jgi:hypothetical protein
VTLGPYSRLEFSSANVSSLLHTLNVLTHSERHTTSLQLTMATYKCLLPCRIPLRAQGSMWRKHSDKSLGVGASYSVVGVGKLFL